MKQILPETISYWLFTRCAHQIVDAASELAALGWTPATSGNFSMQVDDRHVAITISGRNKAHLCHDDIMLIDQQGRAVGNDARPSAETLLHSQIYRRWPIMQVVIHTHSRTQSVASRLFAKSGMVKLRGWELQKAIAGYHSHEEVLETSSAHQEEAGDVLAAAVASVPG